MQNRNDITFVEITQVKTINYFLKIKDLNIELRDMVNKTQEPSDIQDTSESLNNTLENRNKKGIRILTIRLKETKKL